MEESQEREEQLKIPLKETDPQKSNFLLEAQDVLGGKRFLKSEKGFKKADFTTVIIGDHTLAGVKDTIIFYHSERKSFGDLLGAVLGLRTKQGIKSSIKKPIVVQSDLSSHNYPLPSSSDQYIEFVGCGAHARRPFWKSRNIETIRVQNWLLLLHFVTLFCQNF